MIEVEKSFLNFTEMLLCILPMFILFYDKITKQSNSCLISQWFVTFDLFQIVGKLLGILKF